MNEELELKLKEQKEYLEVVEFTMKQLLTTYSTKRTDKKLKKQQKIFDKYKLNSNYKKYQKQTIANMKDLNVICTKDDEIESALEQELNKFNRDNLIKKVMESFRRESYLDDKISKLFSEYNKTKSNIDMYTKSIETAGLQEKRIKENPNREYKREIELTDEEQRKQREAKERLETEKRADDIANSLIAGPKKASLKDIFNKKDMIKDDIAYLYGLAADILTLMEKEQRVNVGYRKGNEECRIQNIRFPYVEEYKMEQLLSKYGVYNVDELLDVYEKIRNKYYAKYSKLKETEKLKYQYSDYDEHKIISVFGSDKYINSEISRSFKTENYQFPPSKQDLINSINLRILNAEINQYVQPKKVEHSLGEPNSYEVYFETKKYYENLTKNMSVEQIVSLYKKVQQYMRDESGYNTYSDIYQNFENYNSVMQKMFSEIIFAKKNKKYSDSKQHDTALLKIVKEDLKEQAMFSMNATDELNQTETNVRQETIEKEYIKYRAKLNLEGKKEYLSFKEFASQKYSLQNMEASLNLENMIEEEIRSVKK